MEKVIVENEKAANTIVNNTTLERLSNKRMLKNFHRKFMGNGVNCPKCFNLAEKIPLRKLTKEIHDLLTENYVFHCFAYCCEYCENSDVEILTYY
jgi:hypothetical protein